MPVSLLWYSNFLIPSFTIVYYTALIYIAFTQALSQISKVPSSALITFANSHNVLRMLYSVFKSLYRLLTTIQLHQPQQYPPYSTGSSSHGSYKQQRQYDTYPPPSEDYHRSYEMTHGASRSSHSSHGSSGSLSGCATYSPSSVDSPPGSYFDNHAELGNIEVRITDPISSQKQHKPKRSG